MTRRALDLDDARWDATLARLEADLQREILLDADPRELGRLAERTLCATCDRTLWTVEYPRPGQTRTARGTACCRACTDHEALALAESHHDSWDASGTDALAADARCVSVGGSSPPSHHLDREPTALERWGRALGLLLCCVSASLTIGLAWYALEGWLR